MIKRIPYGRQTISEDDKEAVLTVLNSDWLTQGPVVPQFEKAVAERCAVPHAVAVSSGTAALHLACMALGLGPGDIVWTTPITFIASVNCARYCGATVDFVDIDPDTLNISVARLADKLLLARREKRLPKLVIPVHFAGRPCDMAAIGILAREFGFKIIEDACHALGARDGNDPVGACRESDITVTSFHPVKIITTGEGGMLFTKSEIVAERLLLLRSHGITRDPEQMSFESEGPWYYQQIELGYNYRMTDIQAALGLSQIKRLDGFIHRRRNLVSQYRSELSNLPIELPTRDRDTNSAWHLFVIRVAATKRLQIFEALRLAGIGVNVHYIPIHLQPDFVRLGFKLGQFPEAERYYSEAISIPLFPGMSDEDQNYVIEMLRLALET